MKHRKNAGEMEEEVFEEKFNMNGEPEAMDDEEEMDPIEERKELIEELFERAEAYAKTNVELFKLKTVEKLSVIVASLISRLVVIVIFSFFFLMVNIGLAIWLGESMGHVYYGFFIVAGLYALIAIILFAFRNPIIKNPVINSIISQVLKEEHHESN